ncbi:MAG: twin-arginine translocase TatA/TatE family subunit [Armatimonadota bacterium]|nr:twin-arginine translocase TatA/TatE family subunit [Armatimonadota bacterium]
MFGLGPGELITILVLALLIFGPKKLPEIGRSLGSAMRDLRRASNDFMSAVEQDEPDEFETDRTDHHTWNDEPTSEHKDEDESDKPKEGE